MTAFLDEAQLELALLDMLQEMGYRYAHGPEMAHDGERAERAGYDQVVLVGRLTAALRKINPRVPVEGIEDAVRQVMRTESASLVENNKRFHQMLTEGVDVEFRDAEGRSVADKVWLADFEGPDNNDWLAVNQFTVIEDKHNRRADVVIFLNGLPIVVIELKNPADANATVRAAYNQLQTYKLEIPSLMTFNECLVISDGLEARAGTLTAGWEWFMPWRTMDGRTIAASDLPQLQVLVRGLLDRERLLDVIRHFVVFESDAAGTVKKMAAYHQYFAVNKAVDCTLRAAGPRGDKRIGVIWHTQGSGKSLSMVFYAGKIIQQAAMENPTIVMLTDRNDLDEQLFDTFSGCEQVLRQSPVQARSRAELQKMLTRASGGVIFTTIQKFFPEQVGEAYPELSDRRNIVVVADEAHRSQYDFIDGFARHIRDALPNASFIGFTGTPIESGDRNTPAVFGEYIDVYDIERAVEDKATVPIYYEGRLAKIQLDEAERPRIDPEFEEVTENQEEQTRQRVASKWARVEAMVGADRRVGQVAADLIEHFDERVGVMDGKGMIVCMSRRICVAVYDAIVKLRPAWHGEEDAAGAIKVVMTGSAADPADWQGHVRSKGRREELAKRFKDPDDPLRLVIVRDMWLTGFDAPCLHTMYVDKPMSGHNLMQAIARVNRVFKNKPGGLVVDYIGLADNLKRALASYTQAGGKGQGSLDQEQAADVMVEKYEIVRDMYHGFDYGPWLTAGQLERMEGVRQAADHVLAADEGKKRYLSAVSALSKAFALAVPHEKTAEVRDEVGFFQAVRAAIVKTTATGGRSPEELDTAVKQIVSKAVASEEVMDIFAMAGLTRPEISILSDSFLAEVRDMPQRNLALEVLKKLLADEIKARGRKNVVEARKFSEMLEEAVRKYTLRGVETAEVIEELIELAAQVRESHKRGEQLGLTEDELAFYDALGVNDSAVKVLGDETLRLIAQELVQAVRRNATIDWSVKASVRARLRVLVKRILRRHGYPPDKCEKSTTIVLEQAEVIFRSGAAA